MMKYWIICFLVLTSRTVLTAQTQICADGQPLNGGVTLTLPISDNNATDIPSIATFTVVGINDYVPIVKIGEDPSGQAICVGVDPAFGSANAVLAETTIDPSPNTVFTTLADPTLNTLTIGSNVNADSAFLLLVEGQTTDDIGHDYALELSNDLPIRIFAFASDETSNPSLSLLDDANTISTDADGNAITCDDAGTETCYGDSAVLTESYLITLMNLIAGDARTASLTIDALLPDADTVAFRVQGGAYVLAILVGDSTPITIAESVATVTQLEDGAYQMRCDDTLIASRGIPITFPNLPEGATYTVTAIGTTTYDPVLAGIDETGVGVCADDTPSASSYALNLPTWQIPNQNTSAQITLTSPTQRVLIGGKDDATGDIFLVIEGMSLADIPAQSLLIETTKGMVDGSSYVTTYMIAESDSLDSLLSWLNSEGTVNTDIQGFGVTCDNAGIAENCYGQTVSLRGSTITLAENRVLPLDSVDAQLELPIYPDMGGQLLTIEARRVGEIGDRFVLVIHIVTN